MPWNPTAPAVAVGGNVWPGVSLASGGGDASAGPAGVPWLDSNGWYIQMACARLKAPLWVILDPPGGPAVLSPQSYVKAICDSEAAGARWVISLDDKLRSGLVGGNTAVWKGIASAAGFFRDHSAWKSCRSLGLVGVVSDFGGDDFSLTGEILNLIARRDLLFRVIWKSQAMTQTMAQTFSGLKALIYADAALPEQPLRRKMMDFVEQGGLLITGPAWGKAGKPAPPDFQTQFDVLALGKGRLAVARKEIDDAYQVAVDTQLLLSHRNDLVKIYNSPSSGCTRYTASPDGKTALLQCLSYADSSRGGLRTIWVRDKYRSARLWTIGGPAGPVNGNPRTIMPAWNTICPLTRLKRMWRSSSRKRGADMNRRQFVSGLGAAGFAMIQPARMRASAPTAPVAIARCRSYGGEFLTATGKMFDQLGGLGRIVKGKTVTIKINLTGGETDRQDHLSQGRSVWTHPRTVGGVIHLLDRAGARRIRVVEGAYIWPASLEEFMLKAGWDPDLLLGAAPQVELINTNLPYKGRKPYTRFAVPHGGLLFPAYDLSTAYAESDVSVSMNKIKEHGAAGVTLSIKNLFGITPTTIYGNKVPKDEPAPKPYAGRPEIGHMGSRQPPTCSPTEKDTTSPRQAGYRIPRIIADLAAACPVSVAILEGIETIPGAELPRLGITEAVSPGVLVAGTNVVTTDAVATAVMGLDPMADQGSVPFETCDNTLRLAEELGVGTRDLRNIEVVGESIKDVVFRFREHGGTRQRRPPGNRRTA